MLALRWSAVVIKPDAIIGRHPPRLLVGGALPCDGAKAVSSMCTTDPCRSAVGSKLGVGIYLPTVGLDRCGALDLLGCFYASPFRPMVLPLTTLPLRAQLPSDPIKLQR